MAKIDCCYPRCDNTLFVPDGATPEEKNEIIYNAGWAYNDSDMSKYFCPNCPSISRCNDAALGAEIDESLKKQIAELEK